MLLLLVVVGVVSGHEVKRCLNMNEFWVIFRQEQICVCCCSSTRFNSIKRSSTWFQTETEFKPVRFTCGPVILVYTGVSVCRCWRPPWTPVFTVLCPSWKRGLRLVSCVGQEEHDGLPGAPPAQTNTPRDWTMLVEPPGILAFTMQKMSPCLRTVPPVLFYLFWLVFLWNPRWFLTELFKMHMKRFYHWFPALADLACVSVSMTWRQWYDVVCDDNYYIGKAT